MGRRTQAKADERRRAGRPFARAWNDRRLRIAAVALAGGLVAFLLALVWLPATRIDGAVVPMEFDSFYHARRIADAVRDPSSFTQYDRLNYAPGGTWITWPWAYDWALSKIASAGMALTGARDPMEVLVYLPPVWAFVNAALVVAVGEAAGLGIPGLLALSLLFGASPLTQQLHGAGRIDHHFAEFTFVHLALLTLLRWTRSPASRSRAAVHGVVLGMSQAVQHGLFILQLPLLVTLALLWWRGRNPVNPRTAGAFAAGLLVSTLALALPSGPFREGRFDFTLLSWFHVYVACATSAAVAALAVAPRRPWAVAALAVLALSLAAPMAAQVAGGLRFLGAAVHDYNDVGELRTVLGHTAAGALGVRESTLLYTALVWTGPAALLWGIWRLARPEQDLDVVLGVSTVFGLALMHQQYRLHYFGSLTLWLPLLLEAGRRLPRIGPVWQRRAAAATLVSGLLFAHWPCRAQLSHPPETGMTPLYASLRALYLTMHQMCAIEPGVLLADRAVGNLVRYHCDCGVMASNLLIDDAQARQVERLEALMDGSLAELRRAAPFVKYALVMRADRNWGRPTAEESARNHRGLRGELLWGPLPPGVHLVQEATMVEDGHPAVLARLVDLRPGALAP